MSEKKLITGNEIEEWARAFEKNLEIRVLTKEEATFLLHYTMIAERINKNEEARKLLEDKKLGLASVLYLRIKAMHSYEITPALVLYLFDSGIVDNFGKSTMLANYMQYVAHEKCLKKIGLKEFGMKVFPHGVPTDECWKKAWERNKVRNVFPKEQEEALRDNAYLSDNILDIPQAAQSILNTEGEPKEETKDE